MFLEGLWAAEPASGECEEAVRSGNALVVVAWHLSVSLVVEKQCVSICSRWTEE